MEIRVKDASVELYSENLDILNPWNFQQVFRESYTAYEIDKLIDKLKDAAKEARKNQQRTP